MRESNRNGNLFLRREVVTVEPAELPADGPLAILKLRNSDAT
jgi:hypothetical protein